MSPLKPTSTIGILGSGQLGRMLAQAAATLGFDVVIFSPDKDTPAGRVAKEEITADYLDEVMLKRFAEKVDVVTYEFENIPVETVSYLQSLKQNCFPSPKALNISQDRLKEKKFFGYLGIETAPYFEIISLQDLQNAAEEINYNGVLKTCRDGYDGKGQARIKSAGDVAPAFQDLGAADKILEGFVPFDFEASVICARAIDGSVELFEPARNIHKNGILHRSICPAGVLDKTLNAMNEAVTAIAAKLEYVGVFAVEFFVMEDGDIIANEMAPRVHNSGHWTVEACDTSQFEQHIRGVAGWSLGSAERHFDIEMTNILEDAKQWQTYAETDAALTLYGKREIRAGRKMGHITKRLAPKM